MWGSVPHRNTHLCIVLKVTLVKLPAYVHSSQKRSKMLLKIHLYNKIPITYFNAEKFVAVNISSVQIKNCKRYGVAQSSAEAW